MSLLPLLMEITLNYNRKSNVSQKTDKFGTADHHKIIHKLINLDMLNYSKTHEDNVER